jgi:type IV pilus assembly protein PilC
MPFLSTTDFDPNTVTLKLHTDPVRLASRQNLKVSDRERNRFLIQIVSANRAGIGVKDFISASFNSLNEQREKKQRLAYLMDDPPSNGQMIAEMEDLVARQGFTFTAACEEFPKIFDQTTLVMIGASEETSAFSGSVVNGVYVQGLLEQHIKFLDKILFIKKKIKGELILPILTLFVALIVIGILLKFVMPALKQVFEPLGEAVNPITNSLLIFGGIIEVYWWAFILLGIGIPLAYRAWRERDERVRWFESYLGLRTPVLNRLIVRLAAYQWLGVYKSMVSAGVREKSGLYAGAAIGNLELRAAAVTAADRAIIGGGSIADELADAHPCFSRITPLYTTLKKQEGTGGTEDLENLQKEMERLVDDSLDKLVKMIDPTMKIVLGIIVGYIVIGMYLPMIQLVGSLAGVGK